MRVSARERELDDKGRYADEPLTTGEKAGSSTSCVPPTRPDAPH
jgi:hypothetical protein